MGNSSPTSLSVLPLWLALPCTGDLGRGDVLPPSVPEVRLVSRTLRPQRKLTSGVREELPARPGTWADRQATCRTGDLRARCPGTGSSARLGL